MGILRQIDLGTPDWTRYIRLDSTRNNSKIKLYFGIPHPKERLHTNGWNNLLSEYLCRNTFVGIALSEYLCLDLLTYCFVVFQQYTQIECVSATLVEAARKKLPSLSLKIRFIVLGGSSDLGRFSTRVLTPPCDLGQSFNAFGDPPP